MQSLIYLLRHGEVDSSRPRRFLGQSDVLLNANGINRQGKLAWPLPTFLSSMSSLPRSAERC